MYVGGDMKQPAKDYVERSILKDACQPFWESLLETTINIASGFIVSYLAWVFLVPIFWPEHASSHATAFGITVLFTVTSFLRSLIWRRFFNAELHKAVHKLVKSVISWR